MADLKYREYRILYATIFDRRAIPGPPQVCGAVVDGEADYRVIGRISELTGCPAPGAGRGKLKRSRTPLYIRLCRQHAKITAIRTTQCSKSL